MSGGSGAASGRFFKGKKPIVIWVYTARKTELAFSEKRQLIGFKTELSRQELADSVIKIKKDESK